MGGGDVTTDVHGSVATGVGGERPKPRPVGAVDDRRVVAGSFAVMAVVVGAMWTVRSLSGSGAVPVIYAFTVGVLVIPVVASPIEWFVHRYVYHAARVRPLGAIFTVHTAHHYAFFPTWRYVTGGPARRLSIRRRPTAVNISAVRNAGVRLAHFCWYMTIGAVVVWLPGWVLTHDLAFLAGMMVASGVVSNLFIVVHDTIHRPRSHRFVALCVNLG